MIPTGHEPQRTGKLRAAPEFGALLAYFAAGAGDKSANISTPVR